MVGFEFGSSVGGSNNYILSIYDIFLFLSSWTFEAEVITDFAFKEKARLFCLSVF